MMILHIPTGSICGYVVYEDNAHISLYGSIKSIPNITIDESAYKNLWLKKSVSIYGLREDGGTIFYGYHNNKASVNNGLYVLPEEFELI